MRVLVVGSGGREHALCWKIAQSKLLTKLWCAPGNAGIAEVAECVGIEADDLATIAEFCLEHKADLVVVGPEAPLAAGLADALREAGIAVFGPGKAAAMLESSKVFSKELMARCNVPTAAFESFDNPDAAYRYIDALGKPCVVKADGLAAGKGVVVACNAAEAKAAVDSMMCRKAFGTAGNRVIVEECLEGEEASILVITDGREAWPLASAQDHKRIFDHDEGPNTGGMGAYSPAPVVTDALLREVMERVIYPTLAGLAKEGIEYRGVLYAGIMVTAQGPKTLEFNVRFGDPETEAVLPRISSDLLPVLKAAAEGALHKAPALEWDERSCVSVVCASKGYPGAYEKGIRIDGLDEAALCKDSVVFHAGTKLKAGEVVTAGGRVLAVTALGRGIREAVSAAYRAVEKISFEGMQYRRDIGARALHR
jgi:phosphoribosylamine---glycine ligase